MLMEWFACHEPDLTYFYHSNRCKHRQLTLHRQKNINQPWPLNVLTLKQPTLHLKVSISCIKICCFWKQKEQVLTLVYIYNGYIFRQALLYHNVDNRWGRLDFLPFNDEFHLIPDASAERLKQHQKCERVHDSWNFFLMSLWNYAHARAHSHSQLFQLFIPHCETRPNKVAHRSSWPCVKACALMKLQS